MRCLPLHYLNDFDGFKVVFSMIFRRFGGFIVLVVNVMAVLVLVLPWICAGIAKKTGGFKLEDNRRTREFLSAVEGVAARANAAQQNSFEILPLFVFVLLLAQWHGVEVRFLQYAVGAFLLSRVIYIGAYLADKAMLRSIVWALGVVDLLLILGLALG